LLEADRQLFDTLAPLRLRPGRRFDACPFSESERETIAAGIADAEAEIRGDGSHAITNDLLHRA
jgi:hypothetical protein